MEHDHRIIGCAALYPFADEKAAELACLAVQPGNRRHGYGDALLKHITAEAQAQGLRKLFVLTTRTAHWFIERGFKEVDIGQLPAQKKSLYNYQRRSKVFVKRCCNNSKFIIDTWRISYGKNGALRKTRA